MGLRVLGLRVWGCSHLSAHSMCFLIVYIYAYIYSVFCEGAVGVLVHGPLLRAKFSGVSVSVTVRSDDGLRVSMGF